MIEIFTFRNIDITENTCVICDIDDTFLYFPGITEKWWHETWNEYYIQYNDENIATNKTYSDWRTHIEYNPPKMTDPEGFYEMIWKLDQTKNSSFLFLTARKDTPKSVAFTKENFNHLGINYDNIIVKYSHDLLKGNYIQNNFDLSKFDNVLFIDDYDKQIENVQSIFGNKITCYKFIRGQVW